jgi:hypothetical protein
VLAGVIQKQPQGNRSRQATEKLAEIAVKVNNIKYPYKSQFPPVMGIKKVIRDAWRRLKLLPYAHKFAIARNIIFYVSSCGAAESHGITTHAHPASFDTMTGLGDQSLAKIPRDSVGIWIERLRTCTKMLIVDPSGRIDTVEFRH